MRARGADAFYTGDIAKDIVLAVRTHAKPGDITEDDLRAYRAIEREPVCGPYRAWRICSMGPPSSGGVAVLQILGLLERTELRARAAAIGRSAASTSPRPASSPTPIARAIWEIQRS